MFIMTIAFPVNICLYEHEETYLSCKYMHSDCNISAHFFTPTPHPLSPR